MLFWRGADLMFRTPTGEEVRLEPDLVRPLVDLLRLLEATVKQEKVLLDEALAELDRPEDDTVRNILLHLLHTKERLAAKLEGFRV